MYEPSESSFLSSFNEDTSRSSRDHLNTFLASRDISPVRHSLKTPWNESSLSTKRYYIRKSKQAVEACLQEIASQDTEMLFSTLSQSLKTSSNYSSALMDALVECYNIANHWSTRRQILSIMADKVSFKQLKLWIPDITRYRYNIARHHCLLHGRGAVVANDKKTRIYIFYVRLGLKVKNSITLGA